MASTISAGTSAGTAIAITGDTSGALSLLTNNGTTAVTIDTSQNVGIGTATPSSFGKLAVVNGTVGVANTGIDGTTGVCYAFQSPSYGTTYQNTIDGSVSSTYSASVIAFKLASGANTTTESMRIQGQNLQFNSGYGSVATAYGCRAWVNFNGTGTVAIRASGNVSSITDNGTGDYTVNFTTAMPDANYTTLTTSGSNGITNNTAANYSASSTSAVRVSAANSTETATTDIAYFQVAVFR